MRSYRPALFAMFVLALFLALVMAAQAQPATDKSGKLDQMLDALKAAPDERAAALLEEQVEQAWLQAATPSVTLLMSQGLRLLNAGQNDNAVASFTAAITLAPDMAEAYRQRAIARYRSGDSAGAVHDLQETLKLDPRNFAAFRTLSAIATARQDWKSAYAAWQKLLELDPKTPGGETKLKELKRKAVGEET
ncbi:tetratricopeptide repeat protein [Rhodopila sp.]|jgi:tetratricopeptide (TPR) repeat protein|uniref:tetratricopeptide repeat protein n=1 Tax=Rhodopila sp. TaxID=2480087 RepID=UPI002C07C04E|nr:tetratricopeptide repeat protein [Rhodopila sp.]HVZ09993.1 tetratricopeptide repeat protein [Rhodopila sp.]